MGRTGPYAYEHSLYQGVEGGAHAYHRRRAARYRSKSQDPPPPFPDLFEFVLVFLFLYFLQKGLHVLFVNIINLFIRN